jgi:hypothetical protein
VPDNRHLFKKGQKRPPNSGRKMGTPNKISPILKQAVFLAAASAGDRLAEDQVIEYLNRVALENPKAFASLLGRAIMSKSSR